LLRDTNWIRIRSPIHQLRLIPKSYGNPFFQPTLLLWKKAAPVWRQRVNAWNLLSLRR
jgi:hypothetical protein